MRRSSGVISGDMLLFADGREIIVLHGTKMINLVAARG